MPTHSSPIAVLFWIFKPHAYGDVGRMSLQIDELFLYILTGKIVRWKIIIHVINAVLYYVFGFFPFLIRVIKTTFGTLSLENNHIMIIGHFSH